jgi:hypothetical protein
MPDFSHEAAAAGPDAPAAARASGADLLGGYSFGARLLMESDDPRPRVLLAPFLDLKRESGSGGALATTQLRQQLRWLRRDAVAAVADFHARIGVELADAGGALDVAELTWGLEQMLGADGKVLPWPEGTVAVAGRNDPLFDAVRLAELLPGLHLIDAEHAPQPLLAAAAGLLQSRSR